MDISAIKSMVSAAATEAVKKSSGVKSGGDATAAETNVTNDAYTSKLADIASRYDVEHITPRQVLAMGEELYSNGLISGLDYGVMKLHYTKSSFYEASPNHFEPRPDNGELDRPDEPRNMLADFKDMVSYLKTNDIERNAEGAKNAQHIVDGLEVLDDLHDKLSSDKSKAATEQGSLNVHAAISSYKNAINDTTADKEHVVNVLEALAAHSQNKPSPRNEQQTS